MYRDLEHPEISLVLRTGYPSWMQESDQTEEFDEDALYEEQRDEMLFDED